MMSFSSMRVVVPNYAGVRICHFNSDPNQEAEREWNADRRKSIDGGLTMRRALPVLRSLHQKAYCAENVAKGYLKNSKNNPLGHNQPCELFQHCSRTVPGLFQDRIDGWSDLSWPALT